MVYCEVDILNYDYDFDNYFQKRRSNALLGEVRANQQKLIQVLDNLLLDGNNNSKYSDFTIVVRNNNNNNNERKEFKVHKAILASRSTFFDKILTQCDNVGNNMFINDDAELIEHILRFIYTGKLPLPTLDITNNNNNINNNEYQQQQSVVLFEKLYIASIKVKIKKLTKSNQSNYNLNFLFNI